MLLRRQRNARASAFTSVVSAAEAPQGAILPGVRISFRPPRGFLTASGTRIVSICAAAVTLPPRQIRPATRDSAPDCTALPAWAARRRSPARRTIILRGRGPVGGRLNSMFNVPAAGRKNNISLRIVRRKHSIREISLRS